jgi:hypothetical protein
MLAVDGSIGFLMWFSWVRGGEFLELLLDFSPRGAGKAECVEEFEVGAAVGAEFEEDGAELTVVRARKVAAAGAPTKFGFKVLCGVAADEVGIFAAVSFEAAGVGVAGDAMDEGQFEVAGDVVGSGSGGDAPEMDGFGNGGDGIGRGG